MVIARKRCKKNDLANGGEGVMRKTEVVIKEELVETDF